MTNMKNGLAVIEVDENKQRAIFLDEEVLFFARLSAATKKRLKKTEQEQKRRLNKEAKRKKEIEDNKRRIENNNYKWRVYTVKTFSNIIFYMLIISGIICSLCVNLISPIIALPLVAVFIAVSGIKFGAWFGRASNRNRKR